VDQIFDRLGNLLRSLFQEDEPQTEGRRRSSADPDLDTAWEELDEFLKTGKQSDSAGQSSYRRYTGTNYQSTTGGGSAIPEEIRRDYANLEVPVNSDMAAIRKSYHRLIRQYHPDRFAANPEKFKDATEITQKINQSYQRLKRYRETGRI